MSQSEIEMFGWTKDASGEIRCGRVIGWSADDIMLDVDGIDMLRAGRVAPPERLRVPRSQVHLFGTLGHALANAAEQL